MSGCCPQIYKSYLPNLCLGKSIVGNVVWVLCFISNDSVTVMEDDRTGNPTKMSAGQSVHEFYTPQLQ